MSKDIFFLLTIIDTLLSHCTGATAVHAGESAAAGTLPATAAAATAASDAASQQHLPVPQQPQQPKTSEEWVDALVHTMSQATDMADARARAAQALQAFEQAVTAQVGCCAAGRLLTLGVSTPILAFPSSSRVLLTFAEHIRFDHVCMLARHEAASSDASVGPC
jgi:hypothetical protein